MTHRSPSGMSSRVKQWENRTDSRNVAPAADTSWDEGLLQQQKLSGHDSGYGKPTPGTKTEYRGRQAGVHITTEIVELCSVIEELGEMDADGAVSVPFGVLFETYTRISNKLVGMLLRGRRQGLIAFQGEMLFQRRDDDVAIRLLCKPTELRADTDRKRHLLATQRNTRTDS